ncbi:MAG TPA: hypothetical protein VKW09_07805 [bacterium]|nr:hypothetical protein [bacterium]
MPGVLYRCVFCEASHEVARRADGPVYLRCTTTHQWAWYDVGAFEGASPARAAARRSAGQSRAPGDTAEGTAGARRRARTPARGRRSLTSAGAKAGSPRRAGRRPAPRASARKPRKGGRR